MCVSCVDSRLCPLSSDFLLMAETLDVTSGMKVTLQVGINLYCRRISEEQCAHTETHIHFHVLMKSRNLTDGVKKGK